MLKWLLRLWHRLDVWIQRRPAVPTHPRTVSREYHTSNLHGRRR